MQLSKLNLALTRIGKASFSPKSLFSSGAQGAWYDPSDLSTLYQDAAGTTPVTGVEQPVGLILDKSKGLVLGPELVVQTNSTSAWNSITATPVVLEDGQIKIAFGGAGFAAFSYLKVPELSQNLKVGAIYRVSGKARVSPGGSVSIKVYSGGPFGSGSATITSTELVSFSYFVIPQSNDIYLMANDMAQGETIWLADISVREILGNHATQATTTSRPTLSARVNQYLATETLSTQGVTTLATNYTLKFTGSGTITLSGTATGVYSAGTHTITCTAGTLISTVAGTVTQADLRVANDGIGLPAYQRVNTATNYDYAGFPPYLKFDGTDDSMATGDIDFGGATAVSVFAGFRKLTSGGYQPVISHNVNVSIADYSFGLHATWNATQTVTTMRSTSYDSSGASANTGAPFTSCVSALYDFGSATQTANVRSNTAGYSTMNISGTPGPVSTRVFSIGARTGTAWFNGRIYSLVVVGKLASAAEIAATEAWVNQKTGAF